MALAFEVQEMEEIGVEAEAEARGGHRGEEDEGQADPDHCHHPDPRQ